MPSPNATPAHSTTAAASSRFDIRQKVFRVIVNECTVAATRRSQRPSAARCLEYARMGGQIVTQFTRRTLRVNGTETVLLEAGQGPPLVYLHGAGTVTGFDFAAAWTRKFRVLIPYHPGFGASADDAAIDDIHDYVLHYAELFDQLA